MAETLVMIHGMWGGPWYWQYFKGFFEKKGYQCVIPTLRFHDMDPTAAPHPQLGTTSLLDYADDLEKHIRQLPVVPILIGHSMGGLLAQILASRGLAKTLVLLTPASPRGINALRPSVIMSYRSAMIRWAFWRKPLRQTFDEAAYSMLNVMSAENQRKVFNRFVYESGRAASEIGFWFLDPKQATKVDESRISCPVLVVAGAQDRITPISVGRKVAKKYGTSATYKEFADHSHWVVGEPGWQNVAEYVADWLRQVERKSARNG